MAFLARFPPGSGWEIDILVIDLFTRVLAKSREAAWPVEKLLEQIEVPHLRAAQGESVLKGRPDRGWGSRGAGRMKARSAPRSVVRFERLNLDRGSVVLSGPASESPSSAATVSSHFDAPSKVLLLSRLLDSAGSGPGFGSSAEPRR